MSTKLGEAYGTMIEKQPWHMFATLTFDPKGERAQGGVHPEKADKAFRLLISIANRKVWGPKWAERKSAQGGIVWVRGQEFHKSGRIHFHACLAAPEGNLNDVVRRFDLIDWWYQNFGIARIERPVSQEDISRYVSKYVAKDGEVDFSANYGRVAPPSLFSELPAFKSKLGLR